MVRVIRMFTAKQPRARAPEAAHLEAFHAERLHHAEARDRLLQDLGDVLPAAQRRLVRGAQPLPEPQQRDECERHAHEGQDREPPVHVEEHRQQPQDREPLLEQVARELRNRRLDLLDVGRQVAHQRAGGAAAQERERLLQDVLVERVAQVGDGALPRVRHERRREVRRGALHHVERQDRERQPPDVDALDERLVEDRLDLRNDERAGGRIAERRDPGSGEPPAIGTGVGEEAPEEPSLEPNCLARTRHPIGQAAPAPRLQRPARYDARLRLWRLRGDRGQRDDFISLAGGNLRDNYSSVTVYRQAQAPGNGQDHEPESTGLGSPRATALEIRISARIAATGQMARGTGSRASSLTGALTAPRTKARAGRFRGLADSFARKIVLSRVSCLSSAACSSLVRGSSVRVRHLFSATP